MSAAEIALKPCPFCGGTDLNTHYQNNVICNGCEAIGPEIQIGSMSAKTAPLNRKRAAEAWNRRTILEGQDHE